MRIIYLTPFLLFPLSAFAEAEPRWEAGIGIGGLHLPHYLGAEQSRNIVVPVPYFIYRGDAIRYDDKGFRGVFFENDKWLMSVSANFSLGVDSEDNDARSGMEDLDPILEFGPKLTYEIYCSEQDVSCVRVELPVRAAVSFDGLTGHHRGFSVDPNIKYIHRVGKLRWNISAAPIFRSQDYANYIYGVTINDATAMRPVYEANSGYTGMRYSFHLSRHFDRHHLGFFISHFDLQGSENADSPLFLEDHNLSAGFAWSWKLWFP